MLIPPNNQPIFTVSRLNGSVRQLIEQQMGRIWLSAELSNFSRPSSGHWYFTLKDSHAQVRCAMFRSQNQRAILVPENGMQVLVRATVTLYDPRGDYQLIVENIHPAGEGLLQQRFQALKNQLETEGLFADIHKKPLPQPAKQVGIITSASGAALHDILQILCRRDPALPVVVYPVSVQGAAATDSLINAINLANQRAECDVIIVGRGGGSLEDLWCFNEERLARAIFASQIPIISAVGHETDVTIADFIADLRAPTPSAAAELVSRDKRELLHQWTINLQRATMAMDYFLVKKQRRLKALQHRLSQQHPRLQLTRQQYQLSLLQNRLKNALAHYLKQRQVRLNAFNQRLAHRQPFDAIYKGQQQLQQQRYRLQQSLQHRLQQAQQQVGVLSARLNNVSPLATLNRGYSVTSKINGQVIKQTKQVSHGDQLTTRLKDGLIISEVKIIKPN